MPVTLKRVAAEAGVSYQTVWRAVHDAPGILPETRAHVREVATRLGYRRNLAASSLRTSRTYTVGLIVLDVANRFTSQLVGGVEAAATEGGCSVLLMNSSDDVVRERRAVHALTGRQVDGIILNPSSEGDHSYLLRELPTGMPLVSINRPIPGVPSATVQSRHTDMAIAARRLMAQGHRWIGGIFGECANTPFLHRRRALQRALRGIQDASPLWFRHGPNTSAFAREATKSMLAPANRPTALIVGGNRLTEGVLLGLRDLGLRQGVDLAVVGFDLPYAALLDPPMPVLLQPAHDMGRLAVTTLLGMRDGQSVKSPKPLPLALDVGLPEC